MYNMYSDDVWANDSVSERATDFVERYESLWDAVDMADDDMPEYAVFTMRDGVLWAFIIVDDSYLTGSTPIVHAQPVEFRSAAKKAFYAVSEMIS